MAKYVMALDAGTTSNRCILFNEQGEICSMAQKEFRQFFPNPGWVEHDANEIWSTMLGVAVEAMNMIRATAADIAAFRAHGFACKLLARAESTDSGVCAYVEPTLVGAGDLEAAVPANFNLITYEAEQLGRQSFYGQGAGRFPTAENVVQDCLTVLSGKRGFYTDRAVPMFLTSGEAHPYYVRTGAPDAFLRGRTAETWDNGAVVTGAVDVYEMLAWAKAQREKDPGVFIAGIR